MFKTGDRVRVVRAEKDTYWYADKIGEEFTLGLECTYDEGRFYVDGYPAFLLSTNSIELVEKPPIKVLFNPAEVESAAEFLSANHKHLTKPVEYFSESILQSIKDGVANKWRSTGTAGYLIVFEEWGEFTDVSIYVKPELGIAGESLEAELRDGKLVVEY